MHISGERALQGIGQAKSSGKFSSEVGLNLCAEEVKIRQLDSELTV